jgi:ABC-type oligopeptide transport system substrate-binding subunit
MGGIVKPSLVFLALSASGCSLGDGEYFGHVGAPDPRHLRWCNNAEPETLDPALAQSSADLKLVYALFDGLTTHDPEGLPAPSLAERWEVSGDLKTYTFHLRGDARWSNGRPITAKDFVYAWARVLHPLTASRNADELWVIRNGQQYTEGTVRVVQRDSPPFARGEVVEVAAAEDTNQRTVRATGAAVTIIELAGDQAWVNAGETYEWRPLESLEQKDPDRLIDAAAGEKKGKVAARDLLMLPEALGVRAEDDRTLVVEMKGPTPSFVELTLLRFFRPVPREAVGPHPRTWTRPEHIVTSGPFHLVFHRRRDRFELERSKTFWGRAEVRLERVTVLTVTDQAAAVNLYYQGSCDALVENSMPNSYLPLLEHKRDYVRAPYNSIYFYHVNCERFPNVHFRRALSMALDRSLLPLFLKGGQIPAAHYVPGTPIAGLSDADRAVCGVAKDTPGVAAMVKKGELCYVPPLGPGFDPDGAAREMDLARAELGDRLPKKITVRFNTGFEQHKHIAEWIQAEWRKRLGLTVELEAQEFQTFLADTNRGLYDVARMGNVGSLPDPETEFLDFFKCKASDNRSKYCDPEFDRLMDEAAQTSDRKRRLELVREAERVMIEAAPILPLYVYTQHVLIKPYVKGMATNLYGQQNLRHVWIDPEWRNR